LKKSVEVFVILFVILGYIRFFEPVFISNRLLNYSQFVSVFVAVILGASRILGNTKRFGLPMLMLLFAIVFSMFMAMLYWDQSLKDTLLCSYEHLIVIFFFFIASSKLSMKDFEKIILGLGLAYLVLFVIQYLSLPKIVFGKSNWGTDEFVERRGTIRFVFPSGGVFFLLSFFAFNKLTLGIKPKLLYIFLSITGLVVPVIQVTRQFIAATVLLFGYNILKNISTSKAIILLGLLSFGAYVILNSDIEIVKGLLEQTESDLGDGSDYIRVQAAEFFLYEFSPNWVTTVFGNGIPYWNMSDYGIYIALLQSKYGFFLEDVGLLGYYAQIGIFGVLSFLLIWFYSFYYTLPKNYSYLKYYLWFLLLTGLTWYSIYHYHYLIITTLVIGMYQKIITEKKINEQ